MSKSLKITGKVLVIQLGRVETQLALVQNGTEVLYSAVLATPIGAVEDGMIQNPEAVERMLKEALREPELKRVRKVVFALCTSQAITEKVTTPDLSGAKLEKLILANADMYFPLDVQDYRLAWEIIGPKTSEAGLQELDVQLWALPNAVLAPYYTVANNCGLSVSAIDYCGHSVATVTGASFALPSKKGKKRPKLDLNAEISFRRKKADLEDEEEDFPRPANLHTDMHILLESDVMGVTCVQNHQVVFQRFIRCGSNPAYQLSELAMMVDYFRAMEAGRGSTIVGILSGSLTNDRELTEELRDMLMGMSLGLLDIPYDLRLTCCIGAARTTLDFGIPSLNRPSKAMQEMRSNLWQYALILVGGLMLISSVFSLLTARLTWKSNLTLMQSNVMLLQAESKKYDGYADNYESYIAAYNNYSKDWDSVFANLQTNNNNLVKVLDELEELLPEKATVTDMQIQATGMNVTFACETKEQAAYMIMALRDLEYADLLAVSSLSGGGAGPATSYGTGKTNEKAPQEGGANLSSEDYQALYDSLYADFLTRIYYYRNNTRRAYEAPYQMGYYMGLGDGTTDYLQDMYEKYGAQPNSSGSSLTDLLSQMSIDDRISAFKSMCTTNPFAMRAAIDMMQDQYYNDGVLNDYFDIKTEFADLYTISSPYALKQSVDKMISRLLYSKYPYAEIFPVVEEVIAGKDEAVFWYICYLEGQKNGTNPHLYMDIDAVITDMAAGAFDLENPNISAMNKTLVNNVLSEETKAILDTIEVEPECSHVLVYADPVAPTCNADGRSGYWYCQTCQLMWLDEAMTQPTTMDALKIPAAHTALAQVEAKEPTAKEEGWYAHWHCSGCGGYWMDESLNVPTTWDKLLRPAQCFHSDMTHTPAVEPTCDTQGNVEYWYCDVCQTYWLDEAGTKATTQAETVLAPNHGNVVDMPYKAPTETEPGNYAYWTCTECGGYWLDEALTQPTDFDSLTIAPNGCKHELKHIDPKEPTCTEPGNMEYWFCEKCSLAWLDEALTQPTLPAATVLPATHKNLTKVDAKEPTVTEDGNVTYWHCPDCGGYWLDEALTQPTDLAGVTIPATGEPGCKHDVILVKAKEATCTEMGYNTDFWYCYNCQNCWLDEALTQLVYYTEVQIPAGHKAVKVEAKEATKTEDGNLEHWYCAGCDSYWLDEALTQPTDKDSVTVPATGESDDPQVKIMKRLAKLMEDYLETGVVQYESDAEKLQIEMAVQMLKPGYTVEKMLDEQLEKYFTYGETDYIDYLDPVIDDYLAEHPEQEEILRDKYEKEVSIELALQEYLETGTTNFEPYLIAEYLVTGNVGGVAEYTDRLNAHVSNGQVDAQLRVLWLMKREDVKELNPQLATMLENFDKGTGNEKINERLTEISGNADHTVHNAVKVEAKEATATQDGNLEHWYCAECRRYWLDEALTKSATKADITIPATGGSVANPVMERLAQLLEDYLETDEIKYADDTEKQQVEMAVQMIKPGYTVEQLLDEQLEKYFTDGETDYTDYLDPVIEDYLAKNPEKEEELRDKYEQDPDDEKPGDEKPGTNDNAAIVAIVTEAAKHLKDYLANGSAGEDYDGIIKLYLTKGTFNDRTLDAIFERVIASGAVNEELTKLIYIYAYQNGQMRSPQSVYYNNGVLTMLDRYHSTGTGSSVLDEQIKVCYQKMLAQYIEKANQAASRGEAKKEQDKRYFFTVVLAYTDELSNAELERKGLDPNEKILLIGEVGEE